MPLSVVNTCSSWRYTQTLLVSMFPREGTREMVKCEKYAGCGVYVLPHMATFTFTLHHHRHFDYAWNWKKLQTIALTLNIAEHLHKYFSLHRQSNFMLCRGFNRHLSRSPFFLLKARLTTSKAIKPLHCGILWREKSSMCRTFRITFYFANREFVGPVNFSLIAFTQIKHTCLRNTIKSKACKTVNRWNINNFINIKFPSQLEIFFSNISKDQF